MADEYDPNAALFGGDEQEMSEEEAHLNQLFGKNPNRTSAIFDLFSVEMMESIDEDTDLPEEAKRQLVFKMTANSVLDMVMECLAPDTAEEVAACLDGYIGMSLTNKKHQVDMMGELRKAVMNVKQNEGESDEDFERRLSDLEDAWWGIPQPKLNGRTPDDAIREEMRRYGLDE